jgi:hypothetical protein
MSSWDIIINATLLWSAAAVLHGTWLNFVRV